MVAYAFFDAVTKTGGMTQGFCGFFCSLGLAGAVVLAVGQVVVLGSDVSFYVCKS